MPISKLSIVNAALARIGHSTLSSFDSDLGRRVDALYQSVVRAKLAAHPWKFAAREITLTPRVPTNGDIDTRYLQHYLLPDEVIQVLGLVSEYEFEIRGRTLSTQEGMRQVGVTPEPECDPIFEGPVLVVVIAVTEGYFSESFRIALEYQLAGEMAITVTEDEAKASGWLRMAKEEFRRARIKNDQSATNATVNNAIERFIYRQVTPRY